MNNPLISIILPTWNRNYLLFEAISKILKQSYKNFELIVVDDGSTDNTSKTINQIKQKTDDSRIKYIQLEKHVGGAAARNIAIKSALGQFIASQDDDDEWHPDYLKEQVAYLTSLPKEYGMSYVSYYRILSNGKKVVMPPKSFKPKSGNLYGGDIMKKNYFPHQAALIKKEVFDNLGKIYNEKMFSLYDWELWLRIAQRYKIAHLDKILFTWKYTPGSNSADPKKIWNRINARKIILKEFEKDIKKFGYYPHHIITLAELLMRAGKPNQARCYLIKALVYKPFSLKLWLKVFLSILGSRAYIYFHKLKAESKFRKIKIK